MSNKDVKNTGRVQYIEPTNLFSQREGSYSDGINYPYEDYNMVVELTIENCNRYSCGFGEYNGETNKTKFSTKNGSISFLKGSGGYEGDDTFLTINYTDISMTSPEKNTSECLGIESISISYNSWFYPQVVIKFIDVRGGTVMQPAEKNYYNFNGGNTSEIYKALFSFPYPIFTLKVKGFYGKGVTYKLAVEKTDLEFDSNTGNFNITASFIGYMYGVYADMPMTYIAVSPYTLTGKEYWKKQIANGVFVFKDGNGNNKSPMLTIPELRLKLAEAAANEDAISAAAEGKQITNIYDERKNKLGELLSALPLQDWLEIEESNYIYKVYPSSADTSFTELHTSINNYITSVSGYDQTYETSYLAELEPLVNYAISGVGINYFVFNKDDKEYRKWVSNKEYIKATEKELETAYNKQIKKFKNIDHYIDEKKKDVSYFILAVFDLGRTNLLKNYKAILNSESKCISDEQTNEERKYKEKQSSIIEKVLGFKPSIRNIYELIFAHMDTFTHCFYTANRAIRDELEKNSDVRKKSYQQIVDGETDTEREKIKTSSGTEIDNVNERSHYLPPYTGFYKEEYGHQKTTKVLRWPGELIHGDELREVKFVQELLSAAELYSDDFKEVEKIISTLSSGVTDGEIINSTTNEDAPSVNVVKFIPLTTYDYINKDSIGNPYESVAEKVKSGDETAMSEILGILATRMYYYQMINKDLPVNMTKIGQLEAINLFKVVKDKFTQNFISTLKDCVDKFSDTKSSAGECIEHITSSKDSKLNVAWKKNGAVNLEKSLFTTIGNNVVYNLHKGVNAKGKKYKLLPLEFNGFTSLKKDYVNDKKLIEDKRFLAIENDDVFYNEENNVSTFTLFESRKYIDNILNSLEKEIEDANKIEPYGNRESSQFGKLKFNVGDFKFIRNNVLKFDDVDYNSNAYAKNAFLDSEGNIPWLSSVENAIESGVDLIKYYITRPLRKTTGCYNGLIFNHSFYNIQTNLKAKACLFLQSLNYGTNEPWNIKFKNKNEHMLKSHLLLEGSFYWMADNLNEFNTKVIHIDGKSFEYKLPKAYEWFKTDGDNINILPKESFSEYIKYQPPQNTTPSRRKYLKQYFEEWVTNTNNEKGFIGNESLLKREDLYNTEDKSLLEIVKLAASEKQSEDAIQSRRLQDFLRDLFFTVCLTMDLYNTDDDTGLEYGCDKKRLSRAFYGFFKQLNEIYGDAIEDVRENVNELNRKLSIAEASNPFKNTDLRLTTYMTLKSLYDKWLCNPYNGPYETWKLTKERDGISDFDNFVYADSFYHDIGYDLMVNISKVSSWLSSCMPTSNMSSTEGEMCYTGKTVYEFLAEVAQDCGGILIALPQKFGLQTGRDIENMFRPISIYDNWDDDASTFVFMYTYKPSEHLGTEESSDLDMNGWSPDGDGLDLTNDELVGKVLSDNGYTIPAFGVTYAKQNQTIFKNLKLSTAQHGVTEAGLAATFNIASKASESPRETTLYGQDLYRVFSKYSYNCGVEMMGNMQITPLMYFQLNNIPLWKGAYTIIKVNHEITAGNINTSFEGVRINRHAIPLADATVITTRDTGDRSGSSGEDIIIGDTNPITGDNGRVIKGNIVGNRNAIIPDIIDFNENNVSERKPVICVTPAHGPKTQKRQEWEWSSKVVDKIVEKLKTEKYYDGTLFNVQRCNKNGKHTDKGYNMKETKNIIKKFGSKEVVSVVPHWNGGAGKYHLVMVDKASNGVREDSLKFGECMVSEMLKVKENRNNLNTPTNMLTGECKLVNLFEKNSDGAPQLECACLLTENWFADYSPKGFIWTDDSTLKPVDGKYLTGRAWLISEEGVETIADAHVKAIKRYVNTL